MDFKNGVKIIQAAGYDGAGTVMKRKKETKKCKSRSGHKPQEISV